jgi:hypothetical protein
MEGMKSEDKKKKDYDYRKDKDLLQRVLRENTRLFWLIVWLFIAADALLVGIFIRLLFI